MQRHLPETPQRTTDFVIHDMTFSDSRRGLAYHHLEIQPKTTDSMVGPRDGGFGFDQSKKYTNVDNLEQICVQCQAGQHAKCLAKSKEIPNCECEHCIVFG